MFVFGEDFDLNYSRDGDTVTFTCANCDGYSSFYLYGKASNEDSYTDYSA